MSLQSLTDQFISARLRPRTCWYRNQRGIYCYTSSSLPRTRCVTASFRAYLVATRTTEAGVAQRISAPDPSTPTTAVSDLNDMPSSFQLHPRLPFESILRPARAAVVVIGHNVAVRAL
jgi:hypothetical protein